MNKDIVIPQEKKTVKKPKKLKPEDIQSYVIRVLEEFNEPQWPASNEKPIIEDIAESIEIVPVTEEDGITKEVEVKKKKVSRKQGTKNQVFEIIETKLVMNLWLKLQSSNLVVTSLKKSLFYLRRRNQSRKQLN